MALPNRSTLLSQVHKVLKKHYEVRAPDPKQSVLEHLIYGILLENASYALADNTLASLREQYFDWNEVRVAAVSDLKQQMHRLPDPDVTAASLRNVLQAVFDTTFSFELEHLRKENLGKAVERLEKFKGSRPFMVSYVVQAALGGHAIPLDRGALEAFAILGAITPAEKEAGSVPGLERTIPKNKGVEFGSLLHHFSADLIANPYSPSVHKVLLEISPSAKDRLPKRPKKVEEPEKEVKSAGDKGRPMRPRPAPGKSSTAPKSTAPPKKPSVKKPAASGARRKPR